MTKGSKEGHLISLLLVLMADEYLAKGLNRVRIGNEQES